NAQTTLERLLSLGIVPVVNENDAVATEEIRFGDNDRLAALVAHIVRADALVLLSDVDGLYDGNPRRAGARLIDEVAGPQDLAGLDLSGSGSGVGGGGVPVARGLVAYDAAELPALLGRSTRELGLREVVHRDDLVVL